jgi:phospholipid-binding lipoprotein MlaA
VLRRHSLSERFTNAWVSGLFLGALLFGAVGLTGCSSVQVAPNAPGHEAVAAPILFAQLQEDTERGPEATASDALGASEEEEFEDFDEEFDEFYDFEEEIDQIADPLEPVNRAFFWFNDKLYFYFFKPIATGYRFVLPQPIRVGIRNFFDNLASPIRIVNCILQGKPQSFSDEFVRFFVNSTIGMAGFLDVATHKLELKKRQEDFGQTLAVWGVPPGFYINWPLLGPYTATDFVGWVGDRFLDPVTYVSLNFGEWIAIKGTDLVNETSLSIGDYEDLKEAALDPYMAMRDAYYQYRKNLIAE